MDTKIEHIINWAYLKAIDENNLPIIKDCIDLRCKFTDENISHIKILFDFYRNMSPHEKQQCFDIFDLFATNYFSQVASNTRLMSMCIGHTENIYLETMIDKGHNSSYPNTEKAFLKSLSVLEFQETFKKMKLLITQ